MGFLVSCPTAENSPQNQAQVQACWVELFYSQSRDMPPVPVPPLKLKPIQRIIDCFRKNLFPSINFTSMSLSVQPWHDMLNISSANYPPFHQTLPQILHANKEHTFLACLCLVCQCEAHRQWKSTSGREGPFHCYTSPSMWPVKELMNTTWEAAAGEERGN